MRVVFDTNVVLSALVFRSEVSCRLRASWREGRVTPLVSSETVRELIRVLAYPKFRLDAGEREELLADYLPWAEVVSIPQPPPPTPPCRDPNDLPFLVLAGVGLADQLVTGDDDLLGVVTGEAAQDLPYGITTVQAILDRMP